MFCSRGVKRTRINTFWAAEATGPMHEFFETKHIHGFGPAFIAVAAEQFHNPERYCCEAFVAFPKTTQPARVAFDRCTFTVPAGQVALHVPIDLKRMLEEGRYLARQRLKRYQQIAYEKTRDASWFDDVPFGEIDEATVRRMWMRNHHRKAFKVMASKTQVQSLREFLKRLHTLPLITRDDA
jgi:hypothetical protein